MNNFGDNVAHRAALRAISRPSAAYGGFGPRFWAFAIDCAVIGLVNVPFRLVLGSRLGGLTSLVLGLAYLGFFEGRFGQTLGKRLMLIRVIDAANGAPIGFSRAILRFAGRFASWAALGLGYWWMIEDAQRQTWHDKFVRSIVVDTRTYASAPTASWSKA